MGMNGSHPPMVVHKCIWFGTITITTGKTVTTTIFRAPNRKKRIKKGVDKINITR